MIKIPHLQPCYNLCPQRVVLLDDDKATGGISFWH